MSAWGWVSRIGGYAAAPFTGGASIIGGNALGSYLDNHTAGGGDKKKTDERAELDPYLSKLTGGADRLTKQAGDLNASGSEALTPALNYLHNILSGNPANVMAATAPERGRVIDQYDTARKSIAQFGPRGGGTTSALAEGRMAEGAQLADITNTARREAFGEAGKMGMQLTGLSLSAEQLSTMNLDQVIQAILALQGHDIEKRGQTMQMWSGIGNAAGNIIGGIFAGD